MRIQHIWPLTMEFDQVFVVNAGNANPNIPLPEKVLFFCRDNISRDLGSYRFALEILPKENLTELVLINDSVHFLQDSLLNFVESARKTEFLVTGLTESMQLGRHLQSYAMHFKEPSPEILDPILKVGNWKMKRTLVAQGERRFSRWWSMKEISFGAIYPNELLKEVSLEHSILFGCDEKRVRKLFRSKVDLNPSIHFWPGLLLTAHIVKKSLLKTNPAKFSDPPKSIEDVESILIRAANKFLD